MPSVMAPLERETRTRNRKALAFAVFVPSFPCRGASPSCEGLGVPFYDDYTFGIDPDLTPAKCAPAERPTPSSSLARRRSTPAQGYLSLRWMTHLAGRKSPC